LDIKALQLTYVLHHLGHHEDHYDHKTNHQTHGALQKWHNGERLPYLEKVEKGKQLQRSLWYSSWQARNEENDTQNRQKYCSSNLIVLFFFQRLQHKLI
jgi:hypothetical protein